MKRILILFFLFSSSVSKIFCQDTAKIFFYNVIKNDSVEMYFDYRNNFTERECARYKRYTKIDSEGNFDGYFKDVNMQGEVIGNGNYKNGIKEGTFEVFYNHGEANKLKCKGDFKNNIPTGYWYFYHTNGKVERKILFNAIDTLLIDAYNEKGEQLVKDGNGLFIGLIGSSADPYYTVLIQANGTIFHGKPNGQWVTKLGGGPYCTETYNQGKFVSEKMSPNKIKNVSDYNDFSYLDIIYLPQYIYRLEEFHLTKCEEVNKMPIVSNSKSDNNYSLENFKSFVTDAISKVIESDVRNNNINDYLQGDNLLKISFDISDKGKPINIKKITAWGDQFVMDISSALSMHAKFPASSSKKIVTITITRDASNYLTYRLGLGNE